MNVILKQASLTVLLVAGGACSLPAQQIQYGVKFGGGAVLGAIDPQASRATMNAAFLAEYALGRNREVFGEFNYRLYRAVDHEVTPFGQLGYTPAGTTAPLYAATSVDVRKDDLDGFALNLGYRQQVLDSIFWWQGGLSLNAMTSQQEVTGQLVPGAATVGAVTSANREGLNFTPAQHSIRPGLFLGAQARLSPNFFIEANLSGVGYQWANYVPRSYTGQPAHVETSNKFKVSLDLNLGFRF